MQDTNRGRRQRSKIASLVAGAIVLMAAPIGPLSARSLPGPDDAEARSRGGPSSMRVAAAQPEDRTIDSRLGPSEVLDRVDRTLDELVQIVRKAGAGGCDVLAFPEDTLGLLEWEAANPGPSMRCCRRQ